jgi:hypothetical protein
MLDDSLAKVLAQLQRRSDKEYTSLFEHVATIVERVFEQRADEVDLALISKLIKLQAASCVENDGLLPYTHTDDLRAAQARLQLFRCAPPQGPYPRFRPCCTHSHQEASQMQGSACPD